MSKTRSTAIAVLLLALSFLGAPLPAESPEPSPLADALGSTIRGDWQRPEFREYDFWLGEWQANWRARQPGELHNADSTGWARHWLFPVLDGKAMIEVARGLSPRADGTFTQGFSIRYRDPRKRRWVMAQNWPAPNTSSGFTDQLQGFGRHGRIELFSGYVDAEGADWIRRYTFSDIAPHRIRWDSARSRDGGQTWIAGTIAEFHRRAAVAKLPEIGEPFQDSPDGRHCTLEPFERFAPLRGAWSGTATGPEGRTRPARMAGMPIQNGCTMLTVLSIEEAEIPYRLLQAVSWSPQARAWFTLHLDNLPDSPHQYRVGREDDSGWVTLGRNADLVIQEDVVPVPSSEPIPETPTERTVWLEISDERARFELQARQGDTWKPVLAIDLGREEASPAVPGN